MKKNQDKYFDPLKKIILPPKSRQLLNTLKDKIVNTLIEFTVFLLTCYKEKAQPF